MRARADTGIATGALVRARDFRGVNADVWSVYMRRYGGGPPICYELYDIYADVASPLTSTTLLVSEPDPDCEMAGNVRWVLAILLVLMVLHPPQNLPYLVFVGTIWY